MKPFAGNGARASELMGAMLNVQLDRLDGMIARDARASGSRSSKGTAQLGNLGLKPAPMNSPDHDCATQVDVLRCPTAEAAKRFTKLFPSVIAGKTGRHTYTEWDQVLMGAGRRASRDEPLQHARQRRLPPHLLQGHVRPLARDPRTAR